MKNTSIKNSFIGFISIIVFAVISVINLNAQTVKAPISELSTNVKFYKYNYKISETQMKVVEYILVKTSTGEIKSCFNACDVCYKAHKGYTQKLDSLRCNNCGLSFAINALGSQGTGGCWPGKLVHTIDGDNVSIDVTELAKGLYYFVAVPLTLVDEYTNSAFTVSVLNDNLLAKFDSAEPKKCQIIGIDGKIYKSIECNDDYLSLPISDLQNGAYFFVYELNGRRFDAKFLVSK